MPVENPTYINGLQPDWPLGSDPESDGDDHLRLIKKAVQNTFPNLNSAITGTPEALNNLIGINYSPADESNNCPDKWDMADPKLAKLVAVNALTPSILELNAHPSLVPTWAAIQNLLYPVGSVVIYADNVNPNTRLGFGTWFQISGQLAGVGTVTGADGTVLTYAAGAQGTGLIQSENIKEFTVTPTASFTGNPVEDHTHGYQWGGNDGAQGISGDGYQGMYIQTEPAGGHTPSGTVTVDPLHIGSSALSYMPLSFGLYVWMRTA